MTIGPGEAVVETLVLNNNSWDAEVASVIEVLVDPEEIPFPARAADIYTNWKPPEPAG